MGLFSIYSLIPLDRYYFPFADFSFGVLEESDDSFFLSDDEGATNDIFLSLISL